MISPNVNKSADKGVTKGRRSFHTLNEVFPGNGSS